MKKGKDMNDEMLVNMLRNTIFYKGITSTEIAKAINLSNSAISQFKKGKTNVINEDRKKDLYNYLIKK